MKIKEWINKRNMRDKAFAQAIGIQPSSLCAILKMNVRPSLLTAIKINKFTRGEITFEEILGETVEIEPYPKGE